MIEPTQNDIRLAMELVKHDAGAYDTIGRGCWNDHPIVQLVATHRQQAEDAMRERCAKVAANWCCTNEARGAKDTAFASARITVAIRGIDAGGEGE